jgi:hypothetical protein
VILLGRNYRNFLPIIEEYSCPLRFSLFTSPIDGVTAFYNKSNTTDDVEEDEFW